MESSLQHHQTMVDMMRKHKNNTSGNEPSHRMYFHGGFTEYILFKEFHTTTAGALAAACVVLFLVSMLCEVFSFLREEHRSRWFPRNHYNAIGEPTRKMNAALGTVRQMLYLPHVVQTAMHAVHLLFSYSLMLVTMTFNLYLILSVVLGITAGYFLVGWNRIKLLDVVEGDRAPEAAKDVGVAEDHRPDDAGAPDVMADIGTTARATTPQVKVTSTNTATDADEKTPHVSTSVDVGAKEDAGTQGKDTKTEADVVVVKTGADVIKPNAGITATDNSTSQAKNAV